MNKIVHITAHLGGGVGRILSSISIYSKERQEFEHSIITLEPTQTVQFEKLCKKHNVTIHSARECDIGTILEQADIVQVDWWHHPLTSQFMMNYLGRISCRLLVWSHIAGCSYPHIPYNFILHSDAFVFTTPFSLENPLWSCVERTQIIEKADVVISSGIDFDKSIEKRDHPGFQVGYIGFLGYSKTHPEYVKYCESACGIPNIRFSVVGDTKYGGQLINDVQHSEKIRDKVIFTGYSFDVMDNLATFDVFGYPLNPNHYGTAENALLEAMAAGVVPVVLNQCTEKHLIQNMQTGLVVDNISEYGHALQWLYQNPVERERLGRNASEYILNEYHIKATVEKMNKVYKKVLLKNKKIHYLNSVFGETPYDWFSSCYVGDEANIQGTAFSETKGSAKHYLRYFPEDKELRKVVEINERRNKT
ncbi:glycosyltransferase family 4 protein [Desulfosporosinus shakirovi]|uniref:glycosyltransferase family 4 protein n=1 Tax=Desulfosporosinus shakirovi TaxID=2885154 RepID=UPI001E55A53C|nr:glycosyltransferase family 4 protein [Desulfosporosinus sp. SRJS8]MCB8814158.1 glycosyltransferase family 4 protein [Desulfosporosinus sp. SRJS8]